ncbi:hypothetical protein SDC9_77483 [bioreactor metagenome]|uniref:site-specific DNA-methyltransferase (adenine-specific) n=1 Tax=bioreactor metagenome TaxID=1076179 RepID=A0A644YR06_9ZZZZ
MEKEDYTMNYSPLRYPGGKNKLAPFIALLIKKAAIENSIYVEPFAGGSGVALSLLLNSVVDEIVINDYDKAIYSMWRALLTETDRFIALIETVPVNIDEWRNQKRIYDEQSTKYSLELGFAAFYLNRTNRSGILSNAGPIGGFDQTGNYLIDARFNRQELIRRVQKIAEHKSKIHLYNKDIRSFLKSYMPKYQKCAFVYFDPPYFKKGKALYKNFFSPTDHQEIFNLIKDLKCPWIVTYDDVPQIRKIYSSHTCKRYDLIYSLANNGKNSELMFLSDDSLWPSNDELKEAKVVINLRGENDGK